MNELAIIEKVNILGLELNIYGDTENPLFLVKDIAEAIGHSNPSKMLEVVGGKDEVTSGYVIDSIGRKQEMNLLSENQVYRILMRSDKPLAIKIQEGIYNFLKSWRKREVTVISIKDKLLLNVIKADTEESRAIAMSNYENNYVRPLELDNKVKDQQILELQPKASYYDYVLQCKGVVAVSIIAKDFGIKSGQELNKLLHKLGVQFNQGGVWLLYSKYADKGYTQTKTHPYFRTDGTPDSRVQTYWAQKGRLFLYELLKNNGYLPNIEKEYEKEA